MKTLASYLRPEDIRLGVDVASKAELFDMVGRHLESRYALLPNSVARGLSRREQIGSTALGQGVAIPHARVIDLKRILVAYLRPRAPIPFDAPDRRPVSDILVLLVPKHATKEHLTVLADATQMFADRKFRENLQCCGDPLEVKRLFDSWSDRPLCLPRLRQESALGERN